MNLLGRVRRFFSGTVSRSDLTAPTAWLTDWHGGGPTASGATVSTEGALGLPAVWACAQAISGDIGKLPWSVRRERDDGGSDPADDSYAHFLVSREFNPTLSSDVGIALLEQWRDLWGNAYAEIVRDGSNRPVELWPVHPSRVRAKARGREVWYEVHREAGGGTDVVLPGDMIHYRGMGDSLSGYSVIGMARESIGLTAAAENFGASFFGNDATMGITLETPQELKPESRKLFEKYIEEKSKAKFRFMVLPGGVKATRMMVPPEDIQFLDTRKFQGHEICRLFRVPPHKAGFLEDATFSNIEHQAIEYATDTLQPRITGLEKEFGRKLIARSAQSSLFVHCNMNALLRGDYLTRTTGYRALISSGVMTPDEARMLEDMNPSGEEGADKLWMQGAMSPIEILVKGPPEPAPKPSPPAPDAAAAPDQPADTSTDALYTPLFLDAATRCVRRERHALAQAKRVDPRKFAASQAAYVDEAFRALFATVGVDAGTRTAWVDGQRRAAAERAGNGKAAVPEAAAADELARSAMEMMR